MKEPLLRSHAISVTFGGGVDAVRAVHEASIEVHRGEVVGIVGESGSGKTTLVRVLAGLQLATSGEVEFDGQTYAANGAGYLRGDQRRRIQMVFQDPYGSVNPIMRAVDAVAEAIRRWHRVSKAEAGARALGLLHSLGIQESQAMSRPGRLSGGQRQRVSVARAIAPDPDLLLADEPASSIDQSAQAQLLNLFRTLRAERNLAIVFVSHDLSLIRYATTRAYVMKDGDIVEHGPTERVFTAPEHPYTQQLIESTPGRRRRLRKAVAPG